MPQADPGLDPAVVNAVAVAKDLCRVPNLQGEKLRNRKIWGDHNDHRLPGSGCHIPEVCGLVWQSSDGMGCLLVTGTEGRDLRLGESRSERPAAEGQRWRGRVRNTVFFGKSYNQKKCYTGAPPGVSEGNGIFHRRKSKKGSPEKEPA
jgi:hypothetical protein